MKEFIQFSLKVIIIHTGTYFVFGLIMSNIFDYASIFDQPVINNYMRPIDSGYILAGPFLQPIRGLLFAIGIWPLRTIILAKKRGWLVLWNTIIIFGILSTPSAAPCSFEGLIYSKLPLWYHLIGFPELLLQTLTFSIILIKWLNISPRKSRIVPSSKMMRQLRFLIISIMIACFGYIGYAIGGILSAWLAGIEIDVRGPSASLRGQMMFLTAFVINIISIYYLSPVWLRGRINIYILFILFWIIDISVPLGYQWLFSYMMPLHLALILGFFPALIIVISIYLNHEKMHILNINAAYGVENKES